MARFLLALTFLIGITAGAPVAATPSTISPTSGHVASATRAAAPTPSFEKTQEHKAAGSSSWWHMTLSDLIVAIGTIVTAGATVVLAIVTRRLWKVTQKLWEETASASEITKRSLEVAERNVEVAKRNAKSAHLSTEAALAGIYPRLVVAGVEGRFHTWNDPNITWNFAVHLKNLGASDAVIERYMIKIEIAATVPPIPEYTPQELAVAENRQFGKIIEPRNEISISTVWTFTPDDRQEIEAHKKRLWVFGFLTFRNALDDVWEQGYIAVLGPDLAPLQWHPQGDKQSRTVPFSRMPPDAGLESYEYADVQPRPKTPKPKDGRRWVVKGTSV
jgi:hypothetical protein